MPTVRLLPLCLALALTAATLPASAQAAIGSEGLGDPYFPQAGNGGYDVGRYDLDLEYTPKNNRLVGDVEIVATATIDLDRFNLDFREPLKTKGVLIDGAPAGFEHSGQELVITPAAQIPSGSEFRVEVVYRGKPRPVEDPDGTTEGWITTHDGAFAPNEPQGSPSWYPCNDYPTDKALFTIGLTVPNRYQAISNGTLDGRYRGQGRTTWVWSQSEPMATYLATAAIGRFNVSRSKNGPAPGLYAVDPAILRRLENRKRASKPFEATPQITRWLANEFGTYPFPTLGGIVDRVPDFPYALETQTRPIYTGMPSTGLVVHEMAHQWFGNSVTLSSWPQIWLNEGFATYAEWLYSEEHGGRSAAKIFKRLYAEPNRKDDLWRPPPGDPGGPKHLFAGSIYDRGAMTLQALRERVGDEAFFAILRAWAGDHAYGNVTTDEFIALAEGVSGQELDQLFDVWLFQPEKPREW